MLEKHSMKFSGEIGTNMINATENEMAEALVNMESEFNTKYLTGCPVSQQYRLHINVSDEKNEIIVPFFRKISEFSSDGIEALGSLLDFYEVILQWSNDNGVVGDLDEFPASHDLIDSLVLDGYIHTWIENGRGASFTCWGWNAKAKEHLELLGFKNIIDPTEEYS